MRLWEEVGAQLKGVTEAMKELTHEMRDVRERLIRIEAQDQPQKIAKLETDARIARDEFTTFRQESADELAEAVALGAADRQRIEREAGLALAAAMAAATADRTRIEKDFQADKVALEKRLSRMEVIIAPVTAGGSALLAAVIGIIVTVFMGHH